MSLEPRPMPSLTLRFDFDEDTPWPGHAVLCRRQVPLEAAIHLQALAHSPDEAEQIAGARRFAELFILDWTFSEPDPAGGLRKLPVNGDTFVRVLDARVAMELFQRWTEAVGLVPAAPLGSASPAGEPPEPEPVPEVVVIPARKGP